MRLLPLPLLLIVSSAAAETYHYQATAFCPDGESGPSNVAQVEITATNQSATVSWQAPTQHTSGTALDDLQGYRLYRSTDGATFTQVVEVPATVTTFVDEPPLSIPSPPTNLTVQADDLVVYTLVQSPDRIALNPVGTVPQGTECDSRYSANGLYVVPVEAVIWPPDSTVRPRVVVGACR